MKKILFPLLLFSTAFNSFGMEDDDSSVAIEMSEVTPGGIEEATHSPEGTTHKSFCSKSKAAVSCCGIFSLCLYLASPIASAFSDGPAFEASAPELQTCPVRTEEEQRQINADAKAFREKYPDWLYHFFYASCSPAPEPELQKQTNYRKRGIAKSDNRPRKNFSTCQLIDGSQFVFWYYREHENKTLPCAIPCKAHFKEEHEVYITEDKYSPVLFVEGQDGKNPPEKVISHYRLKNGLYPKPGIHGRGGKKTHIIKS